MWQLFFSFSFPFFTGVLGIVTTNPAVQYTPPSSVLFSHTMSTASLLLRKDFKQVVYVKPVRFLRISSPAVDPSRPPECVLQFARGKVEFLARHGGQAFSYA